MDSENLNFIVAFIAGILSFLSPCVLPLVPVYIGHLAGTSARADGTDADKVRTFFHALAFVLGFSVLMVLLGASVGLMGGILYDKLPLLRKVGGIFLVILGLHVIGVLKIPFLLQEKKLTINPNPRFGYLASFAVGMSFSAGWTPCVGTILGTILFLASTTETGWQGASLLAVYALGLGLPFLLTGLAIGSATSVLRQLNRHLNIVTAISGALLIFMGIAIFTEMLTRISSLFYWNIGGI